MFCEYQIFVILTWAKFKQKMNLRSFVNTLPGIYKYQQQKNSEWGMENFVVCEWGSFCWIVPFLDVLR